MDDEYTMSVTTIDKFRACAAAGHKAVDLEAKHGRAMKAGPAAQGTWAHAVIERYSRALVEGGEQPDSEEMMKEARHQIPEDDYQGIRSDLARFFDRFDFSFVGDNRDSIALEERIVVQCDGGGFLAGTVDAWWVEDGRRLHVLDYKTGRVMEHTEAPKRNSQLKTYAGMVLLGMDIDKREAIEGVTVHLVHVRHATQESAELTVDQCLDAAEAAQQVVSSARKGHGRDRYTVGGHCVHCDFRHGCGFYQATPPAPVDTTPDRVKILEEQLKEHRAALRAQVFSGEGVETGLFEAAVRRSEKVSFDGEKVLPVLRDIFSDEQIAAMSGFTKTGMEAAMRRLGVAPSDRREYMARITEVADISYRDEVVIRRTHNEREEEVENA